MKFCCWQHFDLKSSCHAKTTFEFENFKIWFFQKTSDGKTSQMKIVDLQKLWKYVVDNFLILNHLIMQNYVWISQIWNSKFSNDLGWKNFLKENCRSPKVMKLRSWHLFDLKSSYLAKLRLNLSNLKFEFFKRPRMEKTS